MSQNTDESKGNCPAEIQLATEFPDLYTFYAHHPVARPERSEIWERILRVARNCQPILADVRSRGLDLVRVDQYTPPGTDRRPLYQTILAWLHRIQDPLTLAICLARLTEPEARSLVRKNRELLLRLAREWNNRLRSNDSERTLPVLSQCVMKAVLDCDVPEVLNCVLDSGLPTEARASYVIDLQRFARKPGLARDAIIGLVHDDKI